MMHLFKHLLVLCLVIGPTTVKAPSAPKPPLSTGKPLKALLLANYTHVFKVNVLMFLALTVDSRGKHLVAKSTGGREAHARLPVQEPATRKERDILPRRWHGTEHCTEFSERIFVL